MNNTAELMSLSTFDLARRTIEAQVPTSNPEIFLIVSTSHTSGEYLSSVTRAEIKDRIFTVKIDRAFFNDPAPVGRNRVKTARYSANNLKKQHEEYLANFDSETLAESIVWAERY